jgi:K+-sensing histidine kinase KdpD
MNALDIAVIHDAKNSLSNLLFRLEKHGHLEKEIEIILRTSSRLTNLLLWHKQQEGSMHISVDSASPLDLIGELVSEFSYTFPNINIKLETQAAPVFWFYDDNYIRLALTNALDNACSFAKEEVVIAVSVVDNMLLFSIEDDGNGYSKHLLEAFSNQCEIETSQRGTGLGLKLANVIAEMHHNKGRSGQVMLQNKQGALFEMRLP